MESYDNDIFLLFLDDDLFWVNDEQEVSDDVAILRTESGQDGSY